MTLLKTAKKNHGAPRVPRPAEEVDAPEPRCFGIIGMGT